MGRWFLVLALVPFVSEPAFSQTHSREDLEAFFDGVIAARSR